jgi:hypothetical protein
MDTNESNEEVTTGESNLSALDDVAHPFDQTNGVIEAVEEHAGEHLDNAHDDPDPDSDASTDPDRIDGDENRPLAPFMEDLADGDLLGDRTREERERNERS